jgi:hypothetical protein
LEVQKHQIELLLSQAADRLLGRSNNHPTKSDLFQKSLKYLLNTEIVVNHQNSRLALFILAENVSI